MIKARTLSLIKKSLCMHACQDQILIKHCTGCESWRPLGRVERTGRKPTVLYPMASCWSITSSDLSYMMDRRGGALTNKIEEKKWKKGELRPQPVTVCRLFTPAWEKQKAKHSTRKDIAGDALIQEHIQHTSTRMENEEKIDVEGESTSRTYAHVYTDHGIAGHALNTS